jgi:hypothetical protein
MGAIINGVNMPKKEEQTEKKTVTVTYVGDRKEITAYGKRFTRGNPVEIDPEMFCDGLRKAKAIKKFCGNPDFDVDHPDNYSAPTHAVRENLNIHVGGKNYIPVKQNINVAIGTKEECEEWIDAHGNTERNTHRIVSLRNG